MMQAMEASVVMVTMVVMVMIAAINHWKMKKDRHRGEWGQWEKEDDEVDCHGRVVVVTGCDSGIGYSLALAARAWGWSVVATCLTTEDTPTTSRLRQEGVHLVPLDLRQPHTLQNLITTLDALRAENQGDDRCFILIISTALEEIGVSKNYEKYSFPFSKYNLSLIPKKYYQINKSVSTKMDQIFYTNIFLFNFYIYIP